jgi:hypothetical protein
VNSAWLISWLQGLLFFCCAFTAAKLYYLGLHRRYRILFIYLALRVPHSVWPLLLNVRSNAYYYVWLATSPVFLTLYIMIVFELYRLVLENYRGLHSLFRWAMYVFSIVAVSLSGLSLLLQIKPSDSGRNIIIRVAFAVERGVDTSLAVFLILLLLLLSRYPVRMSANVRLYAFIFPIFFLGNTVALLIRSIGVAMNTSASIVLQIVSVCCVGTWLFAFSRKGEDVPVATRQLAEAEETRLLNQLDALNTTLLRVSRR